MLRHGVALVAASAPDPDPRAVPRAGSGRPRGALVAWPCHRFQVETRPFRPWQRAPNPREDGRGAFALLPCPPVASRYLDDLRRIRPAARLFLFGSAWMGAALAIPWALLQLYLDRLGHTKAEIGDVQAAEAWGHVLIAAPGALLLARWRTPPLLVVASVGTALGLALLPWLDSLLAMKVCKVAIGACWWLHYVAIAPFLHRHSETEERSTLFGLAEAVHTGAMVLGFLVSGRVADHLARHFEDPAFGLGLVLSCSGLLALCSVPFYAAIRETRPEQERALRILPTLVRHRGLLARFVVPQAVVALGAGLVIPFLGLYFQDRFERGPTAVGDLNAAWQLLATLAFLLSPLLVRRLGFVRSMVAVELASIPFFLLLAFTASYPVAVFAFLLRGALMNSASPILKTFMMEASPPGTREAQVVLNSAAWGVAWILGPWIGGRLLDATGNEYAVLMCTTVVLYFAASVATYVLLSPLDPRVRRRELPPEGPLPGAGEPGPGA